MSTAAGQSHVPPRAAVGVVGAVLRSISVHAGLSVICGPQCPGLWALHATALSTSGDCVLPVAGPSFRLED